MGNYCILIKYFSIDTSLIRIMSPSLNLECSILKSIITEVLDTLLIFSKNHSVDYSTVHPTTVYGTLSKDSAYTNTRQNTYQIFYYLK